MRILLAIFVIIYSCLLTSPLAQARAGALPVCGSYYLTEAELRSAGYPRASEVRLPALYGKLLGSSANAWYSVPVGSELRDTLGVRARMRRMKKKDICICIEGSYKVRPDGLTNYAYTSLRDADRCPEGL